MESAPQGSQGQLGNRSKAKVNGGGPGLRRPATSSKQNQPASGGSFGPPTPHPAVLPAQPPGDYLYIPKKLVFSIVGLLILVLLTVMMWQIGVVDWVQRILTPASIEVVVLNSSDEPVDGAQIKIDDRVFDADEQGRVIVDDLAAITYTVEVSRDGYVPVSKEVELERGQNSLAITLELDVETVSLVGKVRDYIDAVSLEGVKVRWGDDEVATNDQGVFTIHDVPVGEASLTFSKQGYHTLEQTVRVKGQEAVEIDLVPEGKVVFVSNREGGKRGVYVVNYDGSNIQRLVQQVDNTEDYQVARSPDRQRVAFLSTRDKRESSGQRLFEPSLYLINIDGSDLIKVSNHYYISEVQWVGDSQRLVWKGMINPSDYAANLYVYQLGNDSVEQLNNGASVGTIVMNSKKTGILWTQYRGSGDPTAKEGVFYHDFNTQQTEQIFDRDVWGVFFTDGDQKVVFSYTAGDSGDWQSVAYNLRTGQTEESLYNEESTITKVVSPNGEKFAYVTTRDGKSDIYVSNLDGTEEQRLTAMGSVVGALAWSTNGRYIIFDSSKPDESARYVVGLTGAPPRKVTDVYLEIYNPSRGY